MPGCFGFSVTALVRSSSDAFFTSSETRLGILAAGLPAASTPWQAAHFALYTVAPSSTAHDRLGIGMNRTTAIVITSITSFVIFMILSPLLVKFRNQTNAAIRLAIDRALQQ